MFESELMTRLTEDAEASPTEEHLRLLLQCAEFINEQTPRNDDLPDACPHGRECWKREQQRPSPMKARLPFIGSQYATDRIVVVGINSRDDGLPDAEIRTSHAVIANLSQGHKQYGQNSYFHYRAAAAIHAVRESLAGRSPEAEPPPALAADLLECCARIQAIQCAPSSTTRRTPTREMELNCPPFLLRGQLKILRPRVLLLLGRQAHLSIEAGTARNESVPRFEMSWKVRWAETGCFSRGTTTFEEQRVEVLAMAHPSSISGRANWRDSWSALLDSLEHSSLV